MPTEDYSTASRGALKIKGVQGSRVDKHKKKKKKPKDEDRNASPAPALKEKDAGVREGPKTDEGSRFDEILKEEDSKVEQPESSGSATRTEAEKRFDERRRKMVSNQILKSICLVLHALLLPFLSASIIPEEIPF